MRKSFFGGENRKNGQIDKAEGSSKLSSNHEILTFLKFPILLIKATVKAYVIGFFTYFLCRATTSNVSLFTQCS